MIHCRGVERGSNRAGDVSAVAGESRGMRWIWKERDLQTLLLLTLLACFCVAVKGMHLGGLAGRRYEDGQPLRQSLGYHVDLNKGAWIEYVMVPGIGEKTARAIVHWRQQHGRFDSIDQLDQVPGIGPVTMEKARPFLYVSPP